MHQKDALRWAMAARRLVAALAAASVFGLVAGRVISQDPPTPKGGDQPEAKTQEPSTKQAASAADIADMMQAWLELGTPGESHKRLDHLVGSWDIVVKSWNAGPESPPTESKGTARTRWLYEGRYLLEEVKSEMVMPDPASGKNQTIPFEGQGITGYDNYKNLYVSIWIDSLSTQIQISKGGMDPEGRTLTMYGEMDEPMLGVHGRTVKFVTRIDTKDRHTFAMYDLHAGDDYKVMEITYTRRK